MSFMDKPASIVYWLGESLYLNITNGCPNNCYFCFRKYKEGINGFNLKLREDPSTDKIVAEIEKFIHKSQWREIVFCGFGEPLERMDTVLEVTEYVKKNYIMPVRIDTNGQGQLINRGRDVVKGLKEAGVDRVSVSLNAHDKQTYDYVCKPKFENSFQQVLDFIESAAKILDTEITTVTIPEVDISKIRQIATSMGAKFRIRQYIPFFW